MTYGAVTERRRGEPRSDAERVANHYGLTIEDACDLLEQYTVEELLPERGAGIERGTAAVYQGVPSGEFVSPYVEVVGHPGNVVPVGEDIRLRAYYEAHCPGQPFYAPAWTVSVKAKGDGLAVKNDTTHFTEGPVSGSPMLNAPSYPVMPNKTVTLEVSLWGNPDAWQELDLTDP